MPDRDLVLVRLHYGRERAQTIAALVDATCLGRRDVEAAIEQLRRDGVAICTGSRGVWLTTSPDELLAQYRTLRRRALHQLANLRQMPRTAEKMRRPLTLWEVA